MKKLIKNIIFYDYFPTIFLQINVLLYAELITLY